VRERGSGDTRGHHNAGMRARTLAHVSDLHLGHSPSNDAAVEALARTLARLDPDHLVISGDLTHRGRRTEMAHFEALFAPWLERGTASVVPGNHDRVGEDAGSAVMRGARVAVDGRDGLWLVRVDSTGPHNRSYLNSHGALCEHVLEQIDAALAAAPEDVLVGLVLHHHVLPLPEESLAERLAAWLGLPHARELALGEALLKRVHGRCDLVLHGHRHVPRGFHLDVGLRRLSIYNAGSSPELGRFRLLAHSGGALVGKPRWVHSAHAPAPAPAVDTWGYAAS
jgi:3',5'-cyclic-AMP phosphodiesterase